MSPFARWGYFVARHNRAVVRVSLLVVLVSLPLAVVFRVNLLGLGYATPGSESDQVTEFVHERTGVAERGVLVVSSENGAADQATLDRALARASEIVAEKDDVVVDVLAPGEPGGGQVSDDGMVVTATVLMAGPTADRQARSEEVQEELEEAMPAGVNAAITGNSPLLADLLRVEEKDLLVAELVGLPIAFVILMLALRSLVAALLPLGLAMVALVVTLGLLGASTAFADWNLFVETLVALVGLAVGIDYSLLIVRRYREELDSSRAPPDAIARTLETAGRTVTFSGAIVATSMVGLAITGLPFFAESAVGIILVVVLMVIGALTLLPALLIRLGPGLDRFKLPDRKALDVASANRWERWARWVMRRPWPVLLATTAVLLACATPALGLKTGTDLNARAMEGEPAADALAVLERAFPDASLGPVEVLITSEQGATAEGAEAAATVIASESLLGEATRVPLGDDAVLLVATPTVAADTTEADQLVRDLRADIAAVLPPGAEARVSGVTAELVDYTDETNDWTPFVLAFALGLALVLLLCVFRSPVLAVKAIVLNLLSIGAAFGLTVLVFQEGLGEEALGFTSLGYIQGWMPLTLFILLFGISMDYEVFMVTRIREERERGAATTDAIARGLGRTGSVVTSAAAIMIAIFGAFVLSSIPEMKQMGFGLALAVLIDATIVRAALVPAFMKIAGRWNWWMPARLDRLLPNFDHTDGEPAVSPAQTPQ